MRYSGADHCGQRSGRIKRSHVILRQDKKRAEDTAHTKGRGRSEDDRGLVRRVQKRAVSNKENALVCQQ